MEGDNFHRLGPDELRVKIAELDRRIIMLENRDRLPWEKLALLSDLRAQRTKLAALLPGDDA
jgi:hypothetical protein